MKHALKAAFEAGSGQLLGDDNGRAMRVVRYIDFESWYEAEGRGLEGWIAFEDKHPEENQPVLLYSPERIMRFGWWKHKELEYASIGEDDIRNGFTHWMPLPEGPK